MTRQYGQNQRNLTKQITYISLKIKYTHNRSLWIFESTIVFAKNAMEFWEISIERNNNKK